METKLEQEGVQVIVEKCTLKIVEQLSSGHCTNISLNLLLNSTNKEVVGWNIKYMD